MTPPPYLFAQETTLDLEATIRSLWGENADRGTDDSDTDDSANSGTNGGALAAAVEEAALADTVNAATHDPTHGPQQWHPENSRHGRKG